MTDGWHREQLDAFARDGFVVIEEGFVDAGAVAPPWFSTLSVAAKLLPGRALEGGLLTAVSTRSGMGGMTE